MIRILERNCYLTMNYSIDKHQIIITQDIDNYTLLAGLPRGGGEFESYDY